MSPYRPTAGNVVHRTARLLIAIATAITLVAIVACSAEEPPPTDRPDRDQQKLEQTIEAMTGEITALQTETAESDRSQPQLEQTVEALDTEIAALQNETAESQGTPGVERPARSAQQTPGKSSPTPKPPATPTPIVIARPTGPGICGRSPEVQTAIIQYLNVNLCQAITAPELFRITGLMVAMNTAKAGDFQGLTNVQTLQVSAKNVESRAFTQMESLKTITLTIQDEGTIAIGAFQQLPSLHNMELAIATNGSIQNGAFQDLPSLETLQINLKETKSDEDTFTTPDFGGMPNLKQISIHWIEPKTESSTPLSNLPNLESAEIHIAFTNEEPEGKDFQIAETLFENNPNLKTIQLHVSAAGQARVNFPEELFSNNPLLEEASIDFRRATLPRNTFKHLENLKELNLDQYLNEENRWEYHQLALHQSSPLYSVLTLTGQQPRGFRLIEEE